MDRKEFIRQSREIQESEGRHQAAKIKSSLVPGGTTAYETFKVLVRPLYEKRKDEWLYLLMSDLVRREEKDLIDLEELSENEGFITIVSKATLLAQQTHQKENLKALRAIAVNSAINVNKPSEMFDWAVHFLHIVDRISPFHILLLKTFESPYDLVETNSVDLKDESEMSSKELFFMIYPEYRDRSMLITQCWKELVDLGLVSNQRFDKIIHEQNSLKKLTNEFGDKFLGMIEAEE